MESEGHLIAARTAGVVKCTLVRRRPIADQNDQQMLLAMQGTPWDSKGKLATATATAASSGGAEGPTDRVKKVDESLPVEVPEDVPEEGEQDVEGALTRPEKRARGRPRKRVLLDISHPLYFAACSRCAGLPYQHSKGCLRFRQNILTDPTFAARVGLTPEQVQLAQDKGLLQKCRRRQVGQHRQLQLVTAAASGAAAASAVSGTASERKSQLVELVTVEWQVGQLPEWQVGQLQQTRGTAPSEGRRRSRRNYSKLTSLSG
eukprot:4792200-Amphidinium_carterae.1